MDLADEHISIAQVVAALILLIYLVASVFGMTEPNNDLVRAVVLGAVILLFGDAIRRFRRSSSP